MKAIYKNIALAALAFGAAACSQEDDFSLSYLNDSDAVRITAQVGTDDVIGGFTRSNPIGMVDEQKEFNIGDQISVTAETQAPVIYQLGTDGWAPVGDTYLKWQTNDLDITAYYPVDRNNASATTFTIPTEYADVAAMADADYMVYSGTQSKGDDKAIKLTMQRKMVRIVVDEISYNDQFATGYSVTGIKVHSNTKGYILYEEFDEGLPEAGYIVVSALQQGGDFYALLAPTSAEPDGTFLTVTVTNNTNPEDEHTLTVKGIPATVAGNSYNYSLTVGKDKVGIGSVSVKPWTTDVIDGGEAGEIYYSISKQTETAVALEIYPMATAEHIQAAIGDFTTIAVTTALTEEQQSALMSALAGKDVTLYLPKVEKANQASLANDETSGITIICGITNPANTAKGDVAMLDGTFIDTEDLDKLTDALKGVIEPSGIVFWTENEDDGPSTLVGDAVADKVMQSAFPNCTHGLIVSLTDVSTSCAWQGINEDSEQKYYESIYDNFQSIHDTYKNYVSIESETGSSQNINKILGYNNTKVLEAYNAYCKANNRNNHLVKTIEALAEWKASNPDIANTTGWFLPSAKELHMLCYKDVADVRQVYGTDKIDTKTAINTSLGKVDGTRFDTDYYWSSSEYPWNSASGAFLVMFNNAYVESYIKNYTSYVRAVCAY